MQYGRSDTFDDVQEIVVVDDDAAFSDVLEDHLAEDGFFITPVANGESCIDAICERIPAAIVLDITTPKHFGLDVLRSLKASHCPSPVFVVSGAADVRTAVEAMKCGAVDFFEKPGQLEALLDSLRLAMKDTKAKSSRPFATHPVRKYPGRDVLTRRERDVLAQIASGASNKEAGRLLGISPRTVEVHRARIMEKLGARNAADLVRIVLSEVSVAAE
jgi:two-component system, LuxR family, response regulator FixJ